MPLPNFLIIGAAKAGTTSLWHYCGEHPQVFVSRVKECNFFSHDDPGVRPPDGRMRFAVTTIDDYRRLFDAAGDAVAIGEASQQYLRSAIAAARIKDLLPDVRLVVSLREPAGRVYSAYLMHVRQGKAHPDVNVAFGEGSRYLDGAGYFDHLKRYYDLFERERIHVSLFDDLTRDALETMASLFGFLGVDPSFRPNVEKKHNVGAVPRSGRIGALMVTPIARRELGQHLPGWLQRLGRRALLRPAPTLPPDLRDRIRRAHREDVLKVQDLIRRDLSAWLT